MQKAQTLSIHKSAEPPRRNAQGVKHKQKKQSKTKREAKTKKQYQLFMKAIDICTKSTKAKQLLIIYLLILPISEQKRNCLNKAQAKIRNETKYITPTNTKARLHRDNATR